MDHAVGRTPVDGVKLAVGVKIFQQPDFEAGLGQHPQERLVIIKYFVVGCARSGAAWPDPFLIGGIRMISVRDRNAQIAAGLEELMAELRRFSAFFGREMFPNVFGENRRDRISFKVSLPVRGLKQIQVVNVGGNPPRFADAARAHHDPPGFASFELPAEIAGTGGSMPDGAKFFDCAP